MRGGPGCLCGRWVSVLWGCVAALGFWYEADTLIAAHRGEGVDFRGGQGYCHGYLVAVLTIAYFALLLRDPVTDKLLVLKVGLYRDFIQ